MTASWQALALGVALATAATVAALPVDLARARGVVPATPTAFVSVFEESYCNSRNQDDLDDPVLLQVAEDCPAGKKCCRNGKGCKQVCPHEQGVCCFTSGFCCPAGYQCVRKAVFDYDCHRVSFHEAMTKGNGATDQMIDAALKAGSVAGAFGADMQGGVDPLTIKSPADALRIAEALKAGGGLDAINAAAAAAMGPGASALLGNNGGNAAGGVGGVGVGGGAGAQANIAAALAAQAAIAGGGNAGAGAGAAAAAAALQAAAAAGGSDSFAKQFNPSEEIGDGKLQEDMRRELGQAKIASLRAGVPAFASGVAAGGSESTQKPRKINIVQHIIISLDSSSSSDESSSPAPQSESSSESSSSESSSESSSRASEESSSLGSSQSRSSEESSSLGESSIGSSSIGSESSSLGSGLGSQSAAGSVSTSAGSFSSGPPQKDAPVSAASFGQSTLSVGGSVGI